MFRVYADARRWLYERIGNYCSYCNRRIDSCVAVEHIQPKKPAGAYNHARALDWENFLLACVNCNSRKSDKDVELAEYFWPDRDNTMRAVEYHDSGSVGVPAALKGTLHEQIARRTLALTGLDHVPKLDPAGNIPTTLTDPQATDMRYEHRRKVWAKALTARLDLIENPSERMKRRVLSEVEAESFWPIWYHHLADLPGMREELLKIAGTDAACFGPSGELLPRPGGQL